MFSVAGGALGLLVADWAIGPLLRFAPPDVPRLADTQIDWRVLLFMLGISIATGHSLRPCARVPCVAL